MRRWVQVVAGVVALAGVGAGGWWAAAGRSTGRADGTAQAAPAASAAASAPLRFTADEVVQPARGRIDQTVTFSGPLVAPGTTVLRAKAAGVLVQLGAAEGDRVVAGQALGRIDLAELPGRIAERGANLASAQAALEQAERSHASNERLAAQGFISGAALDGTRAQRDAARAALAAAQASLDTTRVAQRDTLLRAPIAGIVSRRHALPGEQVALEQPVLTVVDLRRLELAGSVGTHEVGRLAVGMPVAVQVEGVARPVAGRLGRIAPAAEPGTRAIGVTVVLDNPDERLRAGQYALAAVTLPDDRQRLLLPYGAVLRNGSLDQVWLIEHGKLVRRAVTLGQRDLASDRVEVLGGVDERTQVLAARFDNLREGSGAVVVPATASPPRPPASAPGPATAPNAAGPLLAANRG